MSKWDRMKHEQPPTLYVAGASKEVATIRAYVETLRQLGYEITHDWTEQVANSKMPDHEYADHDRARFALEDTQGVIKAKYFWLVIPENHSLGAWIELGCAIASKSVIIVSGDFRKSIFLEHAHHKFQKHEEALSYFRGKMVSR